MGLYKGTITWQDEDGDISRQTVFLNAAGDALAVAALQTVVETADALSLARVADVSLTLLVNVSAWTLKPAALADSDVEIGGRFLFQTAAGKQHIATIPGYDKNTYSLPGGLIDLTNVTVLAYWTGMVSSAIVCDSNLSDLVGVNTAYEVFSGRR